MVHDSFQPTWVSPPGATITVALREKGVSSEQLAQQLYRTTGEIEQLLCGQAEITQDLAARLAAVIGGSESFWIKRERRYREGLNNLRTEAHRATQQDWFSEIPTKEIVGWLGLPSEFDQTALGLAILQFFAVPSIEEWRQTYQDVLNTVAFRTSPSFESQPGAVAAWLRQGELLSSQIRCEKWDRVKFSNELKALRSLTKKKDPQQFLPELQQRCAECGVALVVLRAPKRCTASGATRFMTPARPLMMLSMRYRSDDHFWFTFFHEAGHLVLHSNDNIFIEGADRISDLQEKEADEFAERILIPESYKARMMTLPLDTRKVIKFAIEIGISPGIVVGQLQHYDRIKRNQLNKLKRFYSWTND